MKIKSTEAENLILSNLILINQKPASVLLQIEPETSFYLRTNKESGYYVVLSEPFTCLANSLGIILNCLKNILVK